MAIVHITNDNFEQEVLNSDKPVLVDFWAPWCGPCRMVAPIVDQLANQFDGKAKVSKVDVDQCPDIAQRYGVMSIPTLMVINGGKVVSKAVGAQPGPKIAKMIQDELSK